MVIMYLPRSSRSSTGCPAMMRGGLGQHTLMNDGELIRGMRAAQMLARMHHERRGDSKDFKDNLRLGDSDPAGRGVECRDLDRSGDCRREDASRGVDIPPKIRTWISTRPQPDSPIYNPFDLPSSLLIMKPL